MPSINPEMLKQLLQEFEEKQAVCREEINAISEQIGELEKRIASSRERLTSVARDREKVGQMRKRYAEGDWSSVIQMMGQKQNGSMTDVPPTPSRMTTTMDSIPSVESPQPVAPAPQPAFDFGQAQPATDIAQQIMPGYTAPAAPSPEQVDAMMSNQPMPQFVNEQPSWDPPPSPAYTPPAPEPIIAPPQPGEGLFSFSGQPQEMVEGPPQADIPWAPPPSMTWESVAGHTFPSPEQQPQPYQQQQPQQGYVDPNQYQQQQQPMPDTTAPPAFDLSQQATPPGQPGAGPPVLTKDYDEEFDISDALRGDDDSAPSSGDSSNEKKIKDALRGLFS